MRQVLLAAVAGVAFVALAAAPDAVKVDPKKPGPRNGIPGGNHLPENLGDQPFEVLVVELKGEPGGAK